MALDASIDLIVASLDLKLVKLLRAAMNTGEGRATPLGPAANPSSSGRPTDRFEPRRVFHPTPRYEPRPVLHPTARVETGPVLAPPTPQPPTCELPAPCEPTSGLLPSPIQPVWKHLPPFASTRAPHGKPPIVKILKPAPIISYKGTLLDFFM